MHSKDESRVSPSSSKQSVHDLAAAIAMEAGQDSEYSHNAFDVETLTNRNGMQTRRAASEIPLYKRMTSAK